mmetsp:Transcript_16323/g.41390  ORF Transcript_16323/g.41390 Transcript_16323/m.41390 type:complete len:215 (+) Transcript_16323:29-673(+)
MSTDSQPRVYILTCTRTCVHIHTRLHSIFTHLFALPSYMSCVCMREYMRKCVQYHTYAYNKEWIKKGCYLTFPLSLLISFSPSSLFFRTFLAPVIFFFDFPFLLLFYLISLALHLPSPFFTLFSSSLLPPSTRQGGRRGWGRKRERKRVEARRGGGRAGSTASRRKRGERWRPPPVFVHAVRARGHQTAADCQPMRGPVRGDSPRPLPFPLPPL